MRTYPLNSPQAATRILALAMLADGHQCSSESAVLEKLDVHEQLGLTRHALNSVVHVFCEDLLAYCEGLSWDDICVMHPVVLEKLLKEIDEPGLQLKVMNLCLTLVDADSQVSDSESRVLAVAMRQWGLERSPRLAA